MTQVIMTANIDDGTSRNGSQFGALESGLGQVWSSPTHKKHGPEADSDYGSNDATQSTRAADSDASSAASAPPTDQSRIESPRPADRIRVQDIPGRTETPPQPSQPTSRPCGPPNPFPLAHRNDVFLIDCAPTPSIRQRWGNIEGPLSKGLKDELQELGTPFKGASMRLVMLGKANSTPADARPSIVVFCLEAQWKGVNKFFERQQVRELYRPRDDEPDMPTFDFYLGPPPLAPKA